LTAFFEFDQLDAAQLLTSIAIGFLSVIWFELVKMRTRKNGKIHERDFSNSELKSDKT
jgi:Ca2+-transporting ATPase